ncbi:hypothetical protein GCM10022233_77690 [Streptomyces shaanxiensis]|uniref:Uncharacterized protein n=1 Tax=Streptomyces shaanxiensis TaxID=653357 RepID=A0ABP7W9J2_9ACTN
MIAAATGVPLRGSLSRASTHVTTVFGFAISTLTQALDKSSLPVGRRVGKVPAPTSTSGKTARRSRRLLETERARHPAIRDHLSPPPDWAAVRRSAGEPSDMQLSVVDPMPMASPPPS